MSPPSLPTERLRSVSQHLFSSNTSTTATSSPTSYNTREPFLHSKSNHPLPTNNTNINHNNNNSTMSSTIITLPTPPRPAITCHVLDTTLGRPAPDIPVSLLSLPSTSPPPPSPPSSSSTYTTPYTTPSPTIIATGTTNSDGRVAAWNFTLDENDQEYSISTQRGKVYMLRFETEEYFRRWYGEEGGFWPWVDVVFKMGGGEAGPVSAGGSGDDRDEGERKHYHVPVLLSRFGYSTYRGS